MELEKKLEKWDALFEELKQIAEQFLPAVEKSVEDATKRLAELEQRMSLFEKELSDIRLQSSEKIQNVEDIKNSFLSVIEDLSKSLNTEISNLRNEFNSQISELKKSIGEIGETGIYRPEIDTEGLRNLEREINEVREEISRLSKEIDQFRNQMIEKYKVIREKKVEGKSPRIL